MTTNAFTDSQRRHPSGPVALSPLAASEGGPDSRSNGAGASVDFFVSLGATLGTIADTLQRDREDRESRLPPANEVLFAAATCPDSGTLTFDLGSVPLGRVWQIRRLIVGGVTVTTTAAGQAYAFAQGAAPADLALTNCVDIFDTLPASHHYGTHQLFLTATEHLFVTVTDGTAGQQYAAACRVEDWHFGSFSRTYSE